MDSRNQRAHRRPRQDKRPLLRSGVIILTLALLFLFFSVTALLFPNPLKRPSNASHPLEVTVTELDLGGVPAWHVPNTSAAAQLLLIHGRSRDRQWLSPLINMLHQKYELFAIDLPGHGAQGHGLSAFGLRAKESIRAALRALDARSQGGQALIIYGASMGGSAALLALDEWRPAALIGVISDGSYAEIEPIIERQSRWVPPPLPTLSRRIAEWIGDFRLAEIRPIESAAKLNIPYFVLHGRADPLIPFSHGERLAAAAPRGKLIPYEGRHDEPADLKKQAALHQALNALLRLEPPH